MLISIQIFSVVSVSNLVAPMLGGIMYDKTGTAGVFGVAFLLLAVDFFMRVLVIEIKVAHRYEPRKLDHCASSATTSREQDDVTAEEQASIEASPLLATRNIGGNPYRLSPDMPAYVHKVPILSCLGDFRLLTALFIGFVQGVLLGSIDGTVPMVAQEYYDFSSLHAGLMFVPIGLANLLLGPLLGWCVDRFGTRIVAVLLYTYLVPVLILFRILHPGGAHQVVVYAVLLALTGIGLAGTGAPSVVEASTIVYKYHEANPDLFGKYGPFAQLYSLTNSCFSLGLAIGPELAGRLRQTIGYGNMNAVLAGICAFTALICLCFIDVKTRVSI
jgi:MFS family permease